MSNQPPIWTIVPSFAPAVGGAEVQAQRQSKALAGRGWRVRVLTRRHVRGHTGLAARGIVDGVPVRRVFSKGATKLSVALFVVSGLWHLALHGRHGIYHAHDIGAAVWLAIAAKHLLRGRCLIKLRSGLQLYQQRSRSRLFRWNFRGQLRLADVVIVVNSEVKEFVVALGVPPSRICTVPNAVDVHAYRPASLEEKSAARRDLGLPDCKAIALYVGRFEPVKGVDVLLRAWSLLPKETIARALLLLVGDGRGREESEAMAQALGIGDSVRFVGHQHSVAEFYRAADFFVLPSRSEGLSNAMVEAMASGLPVIASAVGGAKDLVKNGQNGYLFAPGDAEQLAQALQALAGATGQSQSMGASARGAIEGYAALDIAVERLESAYQRLGLSMNRRRPGPLPQGSS